MINLCDGLRIDHMLLSKCTFIGISNTCSCCRWNRMAESSDGRWPSQLTVVDKPTVHRGIALHIACIYLIHLLHFYVHTICLHSYYASACWQCGLDVTFCLSCCQSPLVWYSTRRSADHCTRQDIVLLYTNAHVVRLSDLLVGASF